MIIEMQRNDKREDNNEMRQMRFAFPTDGPDQADRKPEYILEPEGSSADMVLPSDNTRTLVLPSYTEEVHKKEHAGTGFGVDITGCHTFRDVLDVSGTNWKVKKRAVYLSDGTRLENNFAIVRAMDKKVLSRSTVSSQFVPFQNEDFSSLGQGLMDLGAKPFRGGSYYGGAKVWFMFDMGDTDVMGDGHHHYTLLTNSHDGSGSVNVLDVLVRIVCSNALNYAFKHADFKWSYVHKKSLGNRFAAAEKAILTGNAYIDAYRKEAEALQAKTLSYADVVNLTQMLLPYQKDASDTVKKRVDEKRDRLLEIYSNKDDLQGFGDTAYRFINAVSDYTSHPVLKQDAKISTLERAEDRILTGDPMLQKAYRIVAAA